LVISAIVRWPNGSELDAVRASSRARVQIFPIGLEEIFMELFGNGDPETSVQTDPAIYATRQ